MAERDDPEIARKYPSLYAIARPNQGRPRRAESGEESDEVEPQGVGVGVIAPEQLATAE